MSGWMRLKNTIGTHPKHLSVPAEASWLWTCGIGYCRENLTDGFIPATALGMLGNFPKPKAMAGHLTRVGLWREVDGGFRINDYEQMNLSKAEVQEKLAADAGRKRDGRKASVRADATKAVQSDAPTDSERASTPIYLITHSSDASEGSGDWFWSEWRRVMSGRVNLPAMPKAGDIPMIVAICEAVPNRAVLSAALALFESMPEPERKTRGIKALTLGFFKMALPDLVGVVAIATSCRHGHKPPCSDDIACSARYQDDCQRGIAV